MTSHPPRVTARYEVEAVTDSTLAGHSTTTESLSLELSFDIGQHYMALDLLEKAMVEVRSQIERAAEAVIPS